MSVEVALGAVLLGALVVYALTGGADFGGGVWDLLASGPRAREQRRLVATSIAPIWEANHVWLILVVVVLFTCFPPAFARIATELHVPLTLALVGIVLRGSAFAFRSYDPQREEAERRWTRPFAVASLVTPLILGTVLGAIASGRLRGEGSFVARFVLPWLAPFPLATGALSLALFAYLAAVYLTLETEVRTLREDFRARAIAAWAVAGGLAVVVFLLAGSGAPEIRAGLSWPVPLVTAVAAAGALLALVRRRYRVARACAAAQVALIVAGWGLAQFPYLVEPDLTLSSAAGPRVTLRLVAWTLAAGSVVLVPSFVYLYRVFKTEKR